MLWCVASLHKFTHSAYATQLYACTCAAQARAEASRLRKEVNAANAAKAESMADVAMAAQVQALQDEADHGRRLFQEQVILSGELRATEERLDWSQRISLAAPAAEGDASDSERRISTWW